MGKEKLAVSLILKFHKQASNIIMFCASLCFQPYTDLLCVLFYYIYLALPKNLFQFFRLNLPLNLNFPKLSSPEWLQVVL